MQGRAHGTVLAVVAAVTCAGAAAGFASAGPPSAEAEASDPWHVAPARLVEQSFRPAPRPRRRFETARVRRGARVALRARPHGPLIAVARDRTEFGRPRVLAVVRKRKRWLGVAAPERPNGRLAWVRRDGLVLGRTSVSVVVDLSSRRLALRRGERTVASFRVSVGSPASPTPTGRFAVTDKLPGARFNSSYGCCILALSGSQSRPPRGWRGGNRLAIHGVRPGASVGGSSTAGCPRAANDDVRTLMRRVPPGAPVFVRR